MNITKSDLIKKLNNKTKDPNDAVALAMYSYIKENMLKQYVARMAYPIKLVTKMPLKEAIILVGPHQCGKTTYINIWRNKNKDKIRNRTVSIINIEKKKTEINGRIQDPGFEEYFKGYICKIIPLHMNSTTLIETSTFKTNNDYIKLINAIGSDAKIKFHFWRDAEGRFEKPDPTALCLITGNHNITVKQHINKNLNLKHNWKQNKIWGETT